LSQRFFLAAAGK